MSGDAVPADAALTLLVARAFSGADSSDAQAILTAARRASYPDGAHLCREGEAADTFFLIIQGAVALTQHLGETTRTVAVREAGEFFGEMGVLEGAPRSATATAVGQVIVLEVGETAFRRILADRPGLALAIVRGLVANVRAADRGALVELQSANLALRSALESVHAAQAALLQKERLEHELEIAGRVQRSLLPASFEPLLGFEFAGRNQPARHVGGDLYDVIRLGGGRVALVMADVSDKGVQAALFMAVTRTLFLAHATHGDGPAAVAERVHAGLREIAPESDMFVTAFYGELDTATGELGYVRAGHPEALLLGPDGSWARLSARGRFLGALDGFAVEARIAAFPLGGVLVAYSDGLTDALDASGVAFPLGGLMSVVEAHRHRPAADIADAVLDAVDRHRGDSPVTDDLSILVVRRAAIPD